MALDEKTFAEQLQEQRERLCLSQQLLADLIGVPKKTVQRWLMGRVEPLPWVSRLLIGYLRLLPAPESKKLRRKPRSDKGTTHKKDE